MDLQEQTAYKQNQQSVQQQVDQNQQNNPESALDHTSNKQQRHPGDNNDVQQQDGAEDCEEMSEPIDEPSASSSVHQRQNAQVNANQQPQAAENQHRATSDQSMEGTPQTASSTTNNNNNGAGTNSGASTTNNTTGQAHQQNDDDNGEQITDEGENHQQQQEGVDQQEVEQVPEQKPVEQMTYEEKCKLLNEFPRYQNFYVNAYIDCMDTANQWCLGQIMKIDGNQMLIHFDGWPHKWDDWFRATSSKVDLFRMNSLGYTGQKKVAIRNLQFSLQDIKAHQQELEYLIDQDFQGVNATWITQNLRGKIYIFMDYMLCTGGHTPEVVEAVDEFFRTYMRFFVAWMDKVRRLSHLFPQFTLNPQLYLVDHQIALISCYYELTDMLKKMFACCHRCIRFHISHDCNQESLAVEENHDMEQQQQVDNPRKIVVDDCKNVDFISHNKPDEEYDIDEVRMKVLQKQDLLFGRMLNWLQYFQDIGGFDMILTLLSLGQQEGQEKLPLKIVNRLVFPFQNSVTCLTEEFCEYFTNQVLDITLKRLNNMTDKDLKEVDKDYVNNILLDMKGFLQLGIQRQKLNQIIEQTQLSISMRFLKCQYLEKRLKGINDIRYLIDRVELAERNKKIKQHMMQNGTYTPQNYEFQLKQMNQNYNVRPSDFISSEYLKNAFIEMKILDIIVGENTHTEIIKRAAPVIRFIAINRVFDEGAVNLIWKCQQGKDENQIRVVFLLIEEIIDALDLEYIDMFFEKIKNVPVQDYDQKFLEFLRVFSIKAFEMFYEMKNIQLANQHQGRTNYDIEVLQREQEINQKLKEHMDSDMQGLADDERLYGMPIFWQIIQDNHQVTSITSQENKIQELALESIHQILKMNESKHLRMHYLLNAVKNLLNDQSVPQSISILTIILRCFGESTDNIDETKVMINHLQSQLNIIDVLIKNIQNYHQKVKQTLQQSNSIPDKPEEYVFSGKHKHQDALHTILAMLEFLIILSEEEVSLGVENIEKLWNMFVHEPNFQSDQDLFLNWINKQRTDSGNTAMMGGQETYIFTEKERKYLFQNILCKQQHMSAAKISVGQIKCFHKFFKIINKTEGFINYNQKRMKVIKFKQLLGLDALWSMAIETQNGKAKEMSQELLIDLHLKFDDRQVPIEQKIEILTSFVETCMRELENNDIEKSKGVIKLMSTFLDCYEGKKALKPEHQFAVRFPQIKPQVITVFSKLTDSQEQVQISYFQTLGFLRQKIAEAFGLQINEFTMQIKNQLIDPDIDDEKYIKDISNYNIAQVLIKKNAFYQADIHPKFLISNNQIYFDRIYSMLSENQDPSLLEHVWDLVTKLPVNVRLQENLSQLTGVNKENPDSWNNLLDPSSTTKLLYCLKIIESLFMQRSSKSKDAGSNQEPDENFNQEQLEEASNSLSPRSEWKLKFISQGGFTHLKRTLINLKIESIDSRLTMKCIEYLIKTIYSFMNDNKNKFIEQILSMKNELVLKILHYVDMITEFSIEQEQKRGQSFEDVKQKNMAARLKKKKFRMRMMGNKDTSNDKNFKDDDDDKEDEANQDIKMQKQIFQSFKEQAETVRYLFDFMAVIIKSDPNSCVQLVNYKDLRKLMFKGMLCTENFSLRGQISIKLKEILSERSKQAEMESLREIISIMLFDLLPKTTQHEKRCNEFSDQLAQCINMLHQDDFAPIGEKVQQLICQMAYMIQQRPIVEINSEIIDEYLVGQMTILKALLQKFPNEKFAVGQTLTKYLIHDCLFEIPSGGVGVTISAPKCKSFRTRNCAMELLAVLCRDCLPNLKMVLQYMHQFQQNATWRTKKENDWNVKLFDDEKSTTGYVGIKNLGCICYMNSLNQQLFMLKSFRDDILAIQDPNHDNNPDEDNMFLQWQSLFAGLSYSVKMYVNPKAYCHSFKDWEGQPVNVIEQMDAEEYLNMFLDKLENAIKGTPQAKTHQKHFGGQFSNEVICKTCPHTYERFEPFLTIQVPVKYKKSVHEGMSQYIQGELLENDNKYMCEKCDKKVDAYRRQSIKKLPRYMIMSLKRFDFDYNRMIRIKINDYFEFPEELDMSHYTQEYLSKKEAYEKKVKEQQESGNKDFDQEMLEQEPLKYPKEYYQYTLTGIVVHMGSAETGHYYSFIKEQQEENSNKWYEFNDAYVREFDPADIPGECFGGEDTSFGGNNMYQKGIKMRNAYMLFYKRKLQDYEFSDDEEQKIDVDNERGNNNVIDLQSPMYQKIANENQKYWQNKFLFGTEYHQFVQNIALYWNTQFIIPQETWSRNDDFHLNKYQKQPELLQMDRVEPVLDVPMPFNVPQKEVNNYQLEVFKFLSGYYITILQRAVDKQFLPKTIEYVKSYLNHDVNCARWLISEYNNIEVIREQFLECQIKQMRKFMAGILYCAMIKLYEYEREALNFYWQDVKNPNSSEEPRRTVLGNFILILIQNMHHLGAYKATNSQYFQLIARFSTLGPEARQFLIHAQAIGRLLNYFYDKKSPYMQYYTTFDDFKIQIKEDPDLGMPTPEDTKAVRSHFQELKEQARLKKLMNAEAKYKHLIEILSNCVRSLKIEGGISSFRLNEPVQVMTKKERDLFQPESCFLRLLLVKAQKTRAVTALAMCYCHYNFYDSKLQASLFTTIKDGLTEYDYDKIRPFYTILEFMLRTEDMASEANVNMWLTDLLYIMRRSVNFYLWMEVMLDFVFKITSTIAHVRQWFMDNQNEWEFLFDWVKENRQPPQPYNNQGHSQLTKIKTYNNQMFQKNMVLNDPQMNTVLVHYRWHRLMQLKQGEMEDLSQEIDLDQLDLQDFKFQKGQYIDFIEDKRTLKFDTCQIFSVLDEMINIKSVYTADNSYWISTDTEKILPRGLIAKSYKHRKIESIKQQHEERKRQQQLQQQMQYQQQNQHRQMRNMHHSQQQQHAHQSQSSAHQAQDMHVDHEGAVNVDHSNSNNLSDIEMHNNNNENEYNNNDNASHEREDSSNDFDNEEGEFSSNDGDF